MSESLERRDFLKAGAAVAAGGAALAAALSPLKDFDENITLDEFLQKHYKELSEKEKQEVFTRIQNKVKKEYGVDAEVKDPKAIDGVEFGYALNLSRCIGCRRCVNACSEENNCGKDPDLQYIRVLKLPKESMDIEKSDHHYEAGEVPEKGFAYMPVQCHQCEDAPCVKVCPVQATWKESDGVTVVDYDWCIGCRYCEAACPYWARRFNFKKPEIPAEEINPNMGYLSNRPRPRGVVEKCTFCLHRTREGNNPACQEACPVGARIFGNLLDSESAVRKVIDTKRVFVLKEDAGTNPRFYYFLDS